LVLAYGVVSMVEVAPPEPPAPPRPPRRFDYLAVMTLAGCAWPITLWTLAVTVGIFSDDEDDFAGLGQGFLAFAGAWIVVLFLLARLLRRRFRRSVGDVVGFAAATVVCVVAGGLIAGTAGFQSRVAGTVAVTGGFVVGPVALAATATRLQMLTRRRGAALVTGALLTSLFVASAPLFVIDRANGDPYDNADNRLLDEVMPKRELEELGFYVGDGSDWQSGPIAFIYFDEPLKSSDICRRVATMDLKIPEGFRFRAHPNPSPHGCQSGDLALNLGTYVGIRDGMECDIWFDMRGADGYVPELENAALNIWVWCLTPDD
jgi:hypothetical protein